MSFTPIELPDAGNDLDARIERLMRDGVWRTCTEVTLALSEQDGWVVKGRLRQPAICGHAVHSRKRDGDGLWEYQLEGRAS